MEPEPRLKSGLWVAALIRRAEVAGAVAMVARKGDPDAGAVLLKINRLDRTFAVLSASRGRRGERVWLRLTGADPVPEPEAEARIARQLAADPDLWVVEIEDRLGRPFVDEAVE